MTVEKFHLLFGIKGGHPVEVRLLFRSSEIALQPIQKGFLYGDAKSARYARNGTIIHWAEGFERSIFP